ncbi:MAG: archaellin/type IV pilin N-terminal domain-containing protein [Nitrososphaerales archaeon]
MGSRLIYSYRKVRRRHGISPVIASVIILGITVVLGMALWTFVNGEVNTSTRVFANEVTDYINYLNDRFVIVNIAYDYDNDPSTTDDTNKVTLWIYNNGNLPVSVNAVFFGSGSPDMQLVEVWSGCLPSTPDCVSSLIDNVDGNLVIPEKSMGAIFFDYNAPENGSGQLTADQTYYVKVISESGANQSYFQKNGD